MVLTVYDKHVPTWKKATKIPVIAALTQKRLPKGHETKDRFKNEKNYPEFKKKEKKKTYKIFSKAGLKGLL